MRRAQVAGASLVFVCALLLLLAGPARAATLTNTDGSVTLTTTGPVTSGTPYSSGQVINVSVAANTTLSLTNLEANGYSGEQSMKAEECDDPGGLAANLPTTPTNNCDGQTVLSTSAVNSDGSFTISGYTVYWLPDNPVFGESASNKPTCGTPPDYCVLYVGPAQTDFSKPHIFSAPFAVTDNGDDGGENPGDGSALVAGAVSASESTVVASPPMPVADGKDVAKVTVTLKDTNGNPVTAAKQVTLSASSASGNAMIFYNNVAGNVGTTDASTGVVNFTVSDATAESVTFTATDDSDSDLTLTPPTQPSVQFVAPVVTPANSSISASPTSVPSGSTTITVTLEDQAVPPVPVALKAVTLHQDGNASITTVSGITNGQGQATFTATDASAEAVTFTATDTDDGVDITGTSAAVVTFGTLSVSPIASTVVASPTTVEVASSGGALTAGTVTVTLLAPDGHSVVSGKTVTLSASSTNATVTPSATDGGAVTDSAGKASFTVSDDTAETVTFSAQDTTDTIPITATAAVHFENPAASATDSTVTVSSPSDAADGVTPATIVVTMFDQFGHALPGVAVTVTGSPDATTRVAPEPESSGVPAGTTDSSGHAEFFAYDTTAETVTYSAVDTTDGVDLTETVHVTYQATAPQADNSSVSAQPNVVPADGATKSTVTVTLEDHNSNPVPGKTISLAAAGGSSAITPVSPATDAQGQATFTVTDATSEVVMYTATDTTDSLVLAGQAVAVTFGTPAPVQPAVADSAVVANPLQVPADGATAATVTVVLADADGTALSGRTVALNPQGGSSSVTTVTGVTDADGDATFSVTDKTAESVTYDATDVTDDLPITGQSITVTFRAAGSTGSGAAGTAGTTTTTVAGSGASTTSSTAPPTAAAEATSTGDTGSGPATSAGSSTTASGTLALTGATSSLRWLVALGCILLGFGTVGRHRLTRSPQTARAGGERR